MKLRPMASLRGRLGVGVIALLLFGVVSADLATYVVAYRLYESRISESLEVMTNRILASEGAESGTLYTSDPQSIALTDPYIAIYSTKGELISERFPVLSDGQMPPEVPSPAELGSVVRELVTSGQNNGLSVRARELTRAEQFTVTKDGATATVGSLVVGLTNERARETFRNFIVAQVLVGIVILAIAIGGVLILLRIGLRPLVRVARTAEVIGAGNLSQRIPVEDPSSEIGAVSVALNDAFDKVEQSESRMRGFVADASHELRTPLATIHGWADLYLSNGIREWDEVDTAMTRIRGESERLTDLVEQLLALARLDAKVERTTQSVNLVELVSELVYQESVFSREHRIDLQVSKEARQLAPIISDEATLRQIAVNLISNATRHTPPDTEVDVSVDVDDDADHVLFRVSDNGLGMTAEQLTLAYDRFWRAESGRGPSGGTGLGLAIVRSSVQALGGTIIMESAPGSGLVVTVRLPFGERRHSTA